MTTVQMQELSLPKQAANDLFSPNQKLIQKASDKGNQLLEHLYLHHNEFFITLFLTSTQYNSVNSYDDLIHRKCICR